MAEKKVNSEKEKKMKFILLLLSFSGFAVLSHPLSKPPVASKNLTLLTSKTWVYEEYIRNFSDGSGRQVFKKVKEENEFDLRENWVKFNKDGTFDEYTENGERLSGTWKYLEDEGTIQTRIPGRGKGNTASIILLKEDKFEWHDMENDTYGEMIPSVIMEDSLNAITKK